MIPNSDHGPAWALPLSLLRSASGFHRDHLEAYWIGEMIRRLALKNPKLDESYMSTRGWRLILTRQAKPMDVETLHFNHALHEFFGTHDLGAAQNPWGFVIKFFPLRVNSLGQGVLYCVTRILPPEVAIERLLPSYKETDAYQKFNAAGDRVATRADFIALGGVPVP